MREENDVKCGSDRRNTVLFNTHSYGLVFAFQQLGVQPGIPLHLEQPEGRAINH